MTSAAWGDRMWTQGQVPTRVDIHRSRSVSDKWRGVGFLQHRAIWLSGLWVEGRIKAGNGPKKSWKIKNTVARSPIRKVRVRGGRGWGRAQPAVLMTRGGGPSISADLPAPRVDAQPARHHVYIEPCALIPRCLPGSLKPLGEMSRPLASRHPCLVTDPPSYLDMILAEPLRTMPSTMMHPAQVKCWPRSGTG